MSGDAVAAARSVLAVIQDAVDARDEAALQALFADGVLVGTAGDGRREEARRA